MPDETAATTVAVCKSVDVVNGGRLIVDVGDLTLGIFRIDGTLYAYENVCAHQGGPACQGRMVPRVAEVLDERKAAHGRTFHESEMHVVCPWHGTEYVITTGAHPTIPDMRLRSFPVREEEGNIVITL
jgi:nitrite reductase/ring-hydroxylating ferredoxin subunit